MKKVIIILLSIILGSPFVFFGPYAHAGGAPSLASITPDKTNALADGKDAISLTVFIYDYSCTDKYNHGPLLTHNPNDPSCLNPPTQQPYYDYNQTHSYWLDISGSNNFLDENPFIISDVSGKTTIKLKSTSAETKNITITGDNLSYGKGPTITVSFISPPPVPGTIPPQKKTSDKVTAAPIPAPAPTKPTFSNSTLTKTTSAKSTTLTKNITGLRTNETLTLSGTTSPNAKVTLTIQSNPITVDVTADQIGKWAYILNPKTLKLPLGSHTVTAQATDSKGLKSDTVQLAQFTLKSPPAQTPANPTKSDNYNPFNLINYIAASLFVALGIILAILITKHKKQSLKIMD